MTDKKVKVNLATFPEFVSLKYGKITNKKGVEEAFRQYARDVLKWKDEFGGRFGNSNKILTTTSKKQENSQIKGVFN